MADTLICWNCGESLNDIPRPISRHANCSACFEVLHCCRMCAHYLPDKRPYCDDDRTDPPTEKETANFCDYFKPTNRFTASEATRSHRARSDLDALFGGDADETMQDASVDPDQSDDHDPLSKLNDLFDDT